MLNKFKAASISNKLLYAALTVYSLAFIGFSFFLRPVGDSYVYGQSDITFDGVWGSTMMWFSYNNPMLIKEFMNSLFVGLPIIYLPWWLSSSFAFMVSLGLVAVVISKLGLFNKSLQLKASGLLFFVLANISWMVYWFLGSLLDNGFKSSFMGSMPMENVEARRRMFFEASDYHVGLMSYVAAPAVVILLLLLVNRYSGLNTWRGYLAVLLLGLAGAQVSFTTSFTFISILFIALVLHKKLIKRYPGFNYSWKHLLVMLISSLVLTLSLVKHPAVIARALMNDIREDSFVGHNIFNERFVPRDLFETVGYTLAHTLLDWLLMFGTWGTLLFALFSVGLGFVFKAAGLEVNRKVVLAYSVCFYVAGFIFSVFVAYSHIEVYTASWHQMTVGLFYMLSLLCFGLWLSGVKLEIGSLVRRSIVAAAIVFSLAAVSSFGYHVVERESFWSKGSTGSGFSSDTSAEWEIFAYNKVLEFRGEKDFRNIREVYAPGLDSPPYPFLWKLEKEKALQQ